MEFRPLAYSAFRIFRSRFRSSADLPGARICSRVERTRGRSGITADVMLLNPKPLAMPVDVMVQPGVKFFVRNCTVAGNSAIGGRRGSGEQRNAHVRIGGRQLNLRTADGWILHEVPIFIDDAHRDRDILARDEVLNAVRVIAVHVGRTDFSAGRPNPAAGHRRFAGHQHLQVADRVVVVDGDRHHLTRSRSSTR